MITPIFTGLAQVFCFLHQILINFNIYLLFPHCSYPILRLMDDASDGGDD